MTVETLLTLRETLSKEEFASFVAYSTAKIGDEISVHREAIKALQNDITVFAGMIPKSGKGRKPKDKTTAQ